MSRSDRLRDFAQMLGDRRLTLPRGLRDQAVLGIATSTGSDLTDALRYAYAAMERAAARQRELSEHAEKMRALLLAEDRAQREQAWALLGALDADTRDGVLSRLAKGPPPTPRTRVLSTSSEAPAGCRATTVLVDDPSEPGRVHIGIDWAMLHPRRRDDV